MDRSGWIGGSDASAIVGLSPFKTADELLLEKAGITAPDDDRFASSKEWGQRLEAAVRDKTAEELGCKIVANPEQYTHPVYTFLRAQLDGLILTEYPGGVYEGKTTAASMKAKWKDEAPPEYRVQCVHNLLVTGFPYAVIAVLIGGNQYLRYRIERDEEEILLLLTLELRFWARVTELKGVPECKT